MNQVGIPNLDKQLEASLITDMKKVEDLMMLPAVYLYLEYLLDSFI